MTNRIRIAVLATNAEGSPDLYLTFVAATDLQCNEGQHCRYSARPRRRRMLQCTDDRLLPERRGILHASQRRRVHGRRH
jgi:hypothetical protein